MLYEEEKEFICKGGSTRVPVLLSAREEDEYGIFAVRGSEGIPQKLSEALKENEDRHYF